MNIRCGIVGLPNVGKSTLFNTLVRKNISEAANYPFCTIAPNEAIVEVKDNRLQPLFEAYNSQKTIYTSITFVDIAGIIKGAHKGEGLGNKFLNNIREVDAIIHVVRCFKDLNIINEGSDVLENIMDVNIELALSDLESIEKQKVKLKSEVLTAQKQKKKSDVQDRYNLICDIEKHLLSCVEQGWSKMPDKFNSNTNKIVKSFNLLTTKPMLYVCNIDEEYDENNLNAQKVIDMYGKENCVIIAVQSESYILEDQDSIEIYRKAAYKQDVSEVAYNGIDRLIRASYALLNRISFFTAGEKEVRSWSIEKGSNAAVSAGKIHTDFENGFIKAIVVSYDDFMQYGSIAECRKHGKVQVQGRDYIVQDADVIEFKVK